jgi:ABC-type lipoprotein release transport system permease subunit
MRRLAVVALSFAIAAATLLAAQDARPGGAALPGVLISRQLAEDLGIQLGESIKLSAESTGGNPREFRVDGIYEPTPDPMRINASKHEARLHLPDLESLAADPKDPFSVEEVDAINVALTDPGEALSFARDVAARVPGVLARPARGASGEARTFVVLERFHLAIAIVTILASTVFLLALSVMLVDERRETVGVLRLIGLTTRRILAQVLLEGLLIAGAGALFGLLLALVSQGLINQYFQWHYNTALVFVRITPDVALRSAGLAVPLGAFASVAASWLLLRRSVLSLARR